MDFEPLKYIPEPQHFNLLPKPTLWERISGFFGKIFRFFKTFVPEGSKAPKIPQEPKSPKLNIKNISFLIGVGLFFCLFYAIFISAPANFPVQHAIAVEKGETLSGVANFLERNEMIRSSLLFKMAMVSFGGTKGLIAGDYYLKDKENAISLAYRLSNGRYDLENVRITIPEGYSSKEIARAFVNSGNFPRFDQDQFLKLAGEHEGYLFPDTYMFLSSVDAEQVIRAMTDNFEKRISSIKSQIALFGKPIEDVIKMASIIEREARTEESRRTIAGILWKRLEEGMPLQVDAAFLMVNGKTDSADLTLEDLKIQSPYNTYVNKGLPPGPIANPGLDAILATISPIKTNYYFYLSDSKGNMHYGVTHDQHVANKDRYLR